MAGNAVGLGNFLRFPRQAAVNGGGSFMITYFIALLLLGIPLMWIEWGVGRNGGRYRKGHIPGMFAAIWHHPIAKYLGVIGMVIPLVVMIYYTYIESWTLAFTWFSLTGDYFGRESQGEMVSYLQSFQGVGDPATRVHSVFTPYAFFVVTLVINIWIISKGISGGIEKLARIGMPILFIFAAILAVVILMLPAGPDGSTPAAGLNFVYNPDFSRIGEPSVWLAAAGQIFFTLSVGMGSLQAYASYLKKKDDLVLSGVATCATNETAEVVLGGSLAIPAVVTFFGVTGAVAISKAGGFDLGFVAMPLVFNQLPGGQIMTIAAGVMWFGLLFFAGITSSVSMATPVMSFLEENFGWTRRQSGLAIGALALSLGLLHIFFYQGGFLDEWDYWAGTFGLVILALVETILFVWVFGPDNMWRELHEGAALQLPRLFKFVMTYITPVFLLVMMGWWTVTEAIPTLLMEGKPESEHATRWASRGVMFAILIAQLLLIRAAWRRRAARKDVLT